MSQTVQGFYAGNFAELLDKIDHWLDADRKMSYTGKIKVDAASHVVNEKQASALVFYHYE